MDAFYHGHGYSSVTNEHKLRAGSLAPLEKTRDVGMTPSDRY